MKAFLFALMLVSGPAVATCPAPVDITADLDTLIDEARSSENEMAAREISGRMWKLWLTAPDGAAQELLDQGMRQRASYDFLGALRLYTKLIEYCPDYAEGYNQRAFVYFLSEDYEKALADLDVTLKLSPRHVGAQSGRALTLIGLGKLQEAREQLIEALENNPWISERYLLLEGGPLAPAGKDI